MSEELPRLCIAFTGQLDDFYGPNYGAKVVRADHCDIWGKHEYFTYIPESRTDVPRLLEVVETMRAALADVVAKIPDTRPEINNAWEALTKAEKILAGESK